MYGKTYCFVLKEDPQTIVCAFSLSNETIRVDMLPNSRRKQFLKTIPREKQIRRYPAVLIGRLGVDVTHPQLLCEERFLFSLQG